MQRFIGLGLVAISLSSASEPRAALDVRELLAAAHGAPPAICALAVHAVGNYGWSDAPATPLGTARLLRSHRGRRQAASIEDIRFLLDNLSSGDPCVRELAVRLVSEEEHADWFESQLAALSVIGAAAYLAQQTDAAAGPA